MNATTIFKGFNSNLEQVAEKVKVFDIAEKRPVYTYFGNMDGEDDLQDIPDAYAMFNVSQNRVASIVGERYFPVQHSELFGNVVDALKVYGFQPNIKLENSGDRVKMKMLFPGMTISDDKEKNLHLGLCVGNSYDKSLSAFVEVYFMRISCTNQFSSGNADKYVSWRHPHSAKLLENAGEMVVGSIDLLNERLHTIEDRIQEYVADDIHFEVPAQVEAFIKDSGIVYNGNQRVIDAIVDKVPMDTNRWELYQAVTDVTSHDDRLTDGTRDRLNTKAEKMILNARTIHVPKDYQIREIADP